MAVACAAAELLRRRSLNVDLVMLIEGEEESGSGGFREAVHKNKVREPMHASETPLMGQRAGFDWQNRRDSHQVARFSRLITGTLISVPSNSTWIDETTPCITYGLRGVVHCSIEVSSSNAKLAFELTRHRYSTTDQTCILESREVRQQSQ